RSAATTTSATTGPSTGPVLPGRRPYTGRSSTNGPAWAGRPVSSASQSPTRPARRTGSGASIISVSTARSTGRPAPARGRSMAPSGPSGLAWAGSGAVSAIRSTTSSASPGVAGATSSTATSSTTSAGGWRPQAVPNRLQRDE